jgi:hypothetical protein
LLEKVSTVQQILDQEKSKHVSLVQQNGFDPTFLQAGKKSTAKPTPAGY